MCLYKHQPRAKEYKNRAERVKVGQFEHSSSSGWRGVHGAGEPGREVADAARPLIALPHANK